jgi:integrase
MLMLTGCRVTEVAGARWREVDRAGRIWTIPAERFKSNVQHVVPLTSALEVLLDALPRGQRGDYLFSAKGGASPIIGFSKMNLRLNARMGDVAPWILHDLRRTVRTRLSELKVPEHIAELVIGHGKRGLAKIYNQHQFAEEIRDALDAWANRLHTVVGPTATPPAANVVSLARRARR